MGAVVLTAPSTQHSIEPCVNRRLCESVCCTPGQPDRGLFLCLRLYTHPHCLRLLSGLCSRSCLTRNSLRLFAEHPLQARQCSGHQKHKDKFSGPLSSSPTSAHQNSSTLQACLRCHFVQCPRPPASAVPGSFPESQAPAQTSRVNGIPGVLYAHPSLRAPAGLCCCNKQPPIATGPQRLIVVVLAVILTASLTSVSLFFFF